MNKFGRAISCDVFPPFLIKICRRRAAQALIMHKVFLSTALSALGIILVSPAMAQQTPQPRVAIVSFSTQGLMPWWTGAFDPSEAISDIMTNQLVNTGSYNVIDRQHIQQIEAEQDTSKVGDVSPASEAKLGHMLGANYLIIGQIEQFDKTSGSSGGLGGLGGGLLGGAGIHTQKVTLHVSMRVIEANTGRIVATADDAESKSGTSFAVGGAGTAGGVGYTSSDFTSSTVGQLITTVTTNLVKQLDPAKLVAVAPGPTISAKVLGKDGESVIINAGTNKGVTVGTYFTIYQVKMFKDPDSGKMLESHAKRGTIQILTVDSATATGKLVDGLANTSDAAISGE